MVTGLHIREPMRETPVCRTCDVLVVGGGPAGTAAAACAARLGADTVLVERYGHLGGMSTGGFVLWIDRMTDWSGRPVIAGFAEELLSRMPPQAIQGAPRDAWGSRDPGVVAHWAERHAAFHGTVTWSPTIDPEWLKIVSQELLLERKVTLLYHGWAVALVQAGDEVRGVVFESKAGRQAILAAVVIDCKGDGDIFARAGASYESDVESHNMHHTMNVAFRWGGVDFDRYLLFRRDQPATFEATMAHGRAAGVGDRPFRSPRNDVCFFMAPKLMGYSCLKLEDLTAVEVESRRRMLQMLDFYRKHVPGFEKAWILDTAPQVGSRHSRRLVGVKKVTRSEWLTGTRQDDEIGVCPAYDPGEPNVSIPLGCLVPAGLENLMVAGRNLSCDAASHTFLREVPVCWVMGQGAGVAAALAVAAKVRPRRVNVVDVQREVCRQGGYLRIEPAPADRQRG
jgi:2-polyprenyl-6-methoxyphenol hydroxylase-like FAD-dependent oxidoreductase